MFESDSSTALVRAPIDRPGAALARSLGPLFLLGPVIAVGSILVQRATGQNWHLLIPIIVVAWIIGLLMMTGRLDSLSPSFFLAATYGGNMLLTLAIYSVGVSDFGFVFLYLWEIPFAFHYFGFRRGLTLVAFSALCYGTVVILQTTAGAPLRTGRWFALLGTGVLLGLSVHLLSQAARQSQQRFRSIFEHGAFGMALLVTEGRVLEVNPAFERLVGHTASELQGHRFREYVHPDDLTRFIEAVRAFQAGTKEHIQLESRMVNSDGSDREVTITISGIRGAAGKLAGYVATVEELTERKRAERAEAENQAKSRFLALMSHELRTPLNAVLGFSQLLERKDFGPLTERQTRYVFNIKTAGQHLLTLVNDLLDYSKVVAGRMEFHPEVVDVQSVFDDAMASISPSAEHKGLKLEQSVEPGLTAYADDVRLRQVVLNLLSNAVKFTQTGGISVKAESVGEQTCIAVTDTGIGIPADKLSGLFAEFSQIDSGLNRSTQGTGLGLALSKRFVLGMGGTIDAASHDGEGSTFTVLLPRLAPA
jgi:PAS domain S-box-containing protein